MTRKQLPTEITIRSFDVLNYVGHEVLVGISPDQRWERIVSVAPSAHQGYDVTTTEGTYQWAMDTDGVIVNSSTYWGDSATLDVGRD